jgi:gingipain R
MKWKLFVIIPLITLSCFSQEISIRKFDSKELIFSVSFSQTIFSIQDSVVQFKNIKELTTLTNTGLPALPYFTKSIEIPAQGSSNLSINTTKSIRYSGVKVPIAPKKNKRTISNSAKDMDSFVDSNLFYPAIIGELSQPFIMRDIRGQVVRLYPFQYDSLNNVLVFNQDILVRISFDNHLIKNEIENPFENIIDNEINKEHFLKPLNNRQKYLSKSEKGELLIISDINYEKSCQQFIDWKNQKGIKTTLVNTSSIGKQTSEIKNFIQSYYTNNPKLLYVVLVGDYTEIQPYSYGNIDGDEFWSDSYFGQLTADYYPELFVGRITGNQSEIEGYFQKVINYEKNPAPGNWMKLALGLGSNEGASIGDDGEADWQHLRVIRNNLLNEGYEVVYEFYDGSHNQEDEVGNPIATKISETINKGIGLFNYTGHGDTEIMYSGNYSSNFVSKLENYGKYPFVVSVACNNGKFMDGKCLGEQWVSSLNNNVPNGAIGFCGSSILMDWAPPMKTQDEIVRLIGSADSSYHKTTLGGLFWNGQYSMLEKYGTDGNGVVQTWIFFGDPSAEIRTEETSEDNLEVILSTDSLFLFSKINDGNYCISENNKILQTGTLKNGKLNIALKELSYTDKSKVIVTVSKQNWKPSQKTIFENNFMLNAYPNPSNTNLKLKSVENIESISIYTYDGKELTPNIETKNTKLINLSTIEMKNGIYILNCRTASKNYTLKFEVYH